MFLPCPFWFECPDRDTSMSWYPLLPSFEAYSPRRRESSNRMSPDSKPSMNSFVYGRQVVLIARHWTIWLHIVERQ